MNIGIIIKIQTSLLEDTKCVELLGVAFSLKAYTCLDLRLHLVRDLAHNFFIDYLCILIILFSSFSTGYLLTFTKKV